MLASDDITTFAARYRRAMYVSESVKSRYGNSPVRLGNSVAVLSGSSAVSEPITSRAASLDNSHGQGRRERWEAVQLLLQSRSGWQCIVRDGPKRLYSISISDVFRNAAAARKASLEINLLLAFLIADRAGPIKAEASEGVVELATHRTKQAAWGGKYRLIICVFQRDPAHPRQRTISQNASNSLKNVWPNFYSSLLYRCRLGAVSSRCLASGVG